MHAPGEPLTVERVPIPTPGPTDVLVEVKACGIVPNLGNVLANLQSWYPHLSLPRLPAIFGLDPSGVIADKGAQVHGLEVGQRVYVNPGRWCGGCEVCRLGRFEDCEYYAFAGYFGIGRWSRQLLDDYPYGGMCEYMTAPQTSIVTLPDSVSHETAARWGYLGTGFKALRAAGAGPLSTVLVTGATGTLGLSVVVFALGLGVRKVFAVARDEELLERLRQLAPGRIETYSTKGETASVSSWARSLTGGDGVSIVIDALGPGAPAEVMIDAAAGMRRGGQLVNIGAVVGDVPLNLNAMMSHGQSVIGSCWLSTSDGQMMAGMAESGMVNLDVFEHEVYPLDEVNDALALIGNRHGGFSNYVISPGG